MRDAATEHRQRVTEKVTNIKLTIAYDGANYHGWQVQPDLPTVSGATEAAIERLTGKRTKLCGASRTDAGVHALGQVANFLTISPIPPERFAAAINSVLPPDIRIRESEPVADSFHSRHSAKAKRYSYLIATGQPSPLLRNMVYFGRERLDVDAMQEAATKLVGRYDFSAFAVAVRGDIDPVCELSQVEIAIASAFPFSMENLEYGLDAEGGNKVTCIDVCGDRFLYRMVRRIAGTLYDVGRGNLAPDAMIEILRKGRRRLVGTTLPPYGLYLIKVKY